MEKVRPIFLVRRSHVLTLVGGVDGLSLRTPQGLSRVQPAPVSGSVTLCKWFTYDPREGQGVERGRDDNCFGGRVDLSWSYGVSDVRVVADPCLRTSQGCRDPRVRPGHSSSTTLTDPGYVVPRKLLGGPTGT